MLKIPITFGSLLLEGFARYFSFFYSFFLRMTGEKNCGKKETRRKNPSEVNFLSLKIMSSRAEKFLTPFCSQKGPESFFWIMIHSHKSSLSFSNDRR